MQVRVSQAPVYTQDYLRRVADAYKTNPAAALLPTPAIGLIKDSGFNPNPATTLAEATAAECDFTDYARKTPTLSDGVNLGVSIEGVTGTGTYTITTDPVVTDNTVLGYFVTDGTIVVAAELFGDGQSVEMAEPGDQLLVVMQLPLMSYQSVS